MADTKTIGEGLLGQDIVDVINAASKNPNPRANQYNLCLHTVDIDMTVLFFYELLMHGDYEHNYSDEIVAKISIPMGDFIYDIFPHRDNFEVSLIRETKTTRITTRFKGALIDNTAIPDNGVYNKATREELNKMEMVKLSVQLIDRYTEALRVTPIDGVFNHCKVKDAIKAGISSCCKKIKVSGKPLEVNLNMIEPNNTFLYKHIDVPTGTNIIELPNYLQNSHFGVYNGDIGVYNKMILDNDKMVNNLYVYPIYSNSAFDKVKKKLVIFKSSNPNIDQVENTYFVDGDTVKIVAGSGTLALDMSSGSLISHGGDVATTSPDTAIQRNNVVKADGTSSSYAETNLSVKTNKKRKDGSNRFNYKGNNSNAYKSRSEVLKKSARHFRIPWIFSNPEILYPGMPVMYCYVKDGVINKVYGTLTKLFTSYNTGKKISNSLIEISVLA